VWIGGVANAPGIGPYPDCHDSASAYGQVLSSALDVNFVNLACTGGSYTHGITGPETFGNVTVPPQFPNPAYDQAQPDAVVMTYGSDDFQFSSIVLACMESAVLPEPLQCVDTNPGNTVQTDFFDEINVLAGTYADMVKAIEVQGAAASPPRVPKIIFTDYM